MLAVGCFELGLEFDIREKDIMLVTSVNKDGCLCLGDILLAHFDDLPPFLSDRVGDGPDDVD